MRAKSEKRILAEKLRSEQGLSYREISASIDVNKSTLSGWLRGITLTNSQLLRLQEKRESNRSLFATRAWSINRARYLKAQQQAEQDGFQVIRELPTHRSIDELSLAMLYLGEGSKSYGRVQIASTQAEILRYFLLRLIQLYRIDEARLSFRLNLVKQAVAYEMKFINWWKIKLNYPSARFIKTQYDKRSKTAIISDNYHGVCTLTYYDTYLQRKLISIASVYLNSQLADEEIKKTVE